MLSLRPGFAVLLIVGIGAVAAHNHARSDYYLKSDLASDAHISVIGSPDKKFGGNFLRDRVQSLERA
jgi:hypothetical protein